MLVIFRSLESHRSLRRSAIYRDFVLEASNTLVSSLPIVTTSRNQRSKRKASARRRRKTPCPWSRIVLDILRDHFELRRGPDLGIRTKRPGHCKLSIELIEEDCCVGDSVEVGFNHAPRAAHIIIVSRYFLNKSNRPAITPHKLLEISGFRANR